MTLGFLVPAWFFPRITLLFCYLMDCVPVNPTDWPIDILGIVFFPRLLIAYWLYVADMPFAAVIFLVGQVLTLGGGISYRRRPAVTAKLQSLLNRRI